MKIPSHYHISPKAYELLLWHALHGFKPENDFQNRLYEVSIVFNGKYKPNYVTKEIVTYAELRDYFEFTHTNNFRSSFLVESLCSSRIKRIYEYENRKK